MQVVSIIIPVYNAQLYIERCLKSLLAQDYEYIEIILINDGSTDKSGDICEKYALKYKNIKSYTIENKGVSAARNYGMKCMNENGWLMFVDADDYVESDYVSIMVRFAEKYKESLIGCHSIRENQQGKVMIFHKKNNAPESFEMEQKFYSIRDSEKLSGAVWNKIYSKEILLKNNIQFDEQVKIYEDLLFNITYVNYVKSTYLIANDLYHYVVNKDSAMMSNKFSKEKWKTIFWALKEIQLYIPKEYIDIKQAFDADYFRDLLSYWIIMYKSGQYEKPSREEKSELKEKKMNIKHCGIKSICMYYGILYMPAVIYSLVRCKLLVKDLLE